MNKQILFPLFLFFMGFVHLHAQPRGAQFVWANANDAQRFQVVAFRYDLVLDATPESAQLHIFADSRYHLLINGAVLQFGPGRFYPAHPEFDTHDLRPYLRPGNNAIVVKVFSNGTSSFQLRRAPGAFIAWGEVRTATGSKYALHTPGNWKCLRLQGYDPQTPRMSFALAPVEVYDARKDPAGWQDPEVPFPGQQPVSIPSVWGTLQPRSIPPLTQEIHRPRELTGAYRHQDIEDVYSFRVKVPDSTQAEFREGYPLFGYTWIYSLREQVVPAGIWWGEHFLNGEGPLVQSDAGDAKPHRQQTNLELKAGWNYFFVRRNSFWGKWDFFLALPRDAGLVLSATKQMDSPEIFRTAGPFTREEQAQVLALPIPFAPEALPSTLSAGWRDQLRDGNAANPAVEMSWRYFGEKLPFPAYQTTDLTVDAGSSLIVDFRYKQLARIVVEYEAPASTVVDVAFTEDLLHNRPWIMKRNGIYPATRHIAREGLNRLETLRPYGFRYLQLDITGNHAPVTLRRIEAVSQVYPFEQQGTFACSDPLLNEIWKIGWRTLRVCAEDSYTDTPFRERGLYAGDMLPQMAITLAGSGDLRLVRRSLLLFQDMYTELFHPNTERHPDEIGLLEDYPLLTLEALSWYIDRTGEVALADSLFDNYDYLVRSVLERRDASGLIHNEQVFIEWTQIEKKEVNNTAYHALLARSCRVMARLAKMTGREKAAITYDRAATELTTALHRHYWDEATGAYRDGIKMGTPIDHQYPISSAWPSLFDLTTDQQEARFFPYIADQLTDIGTENRRRKTTPYGSFYLLLALAQRGMGAEAEQFIRKYWSPMVYRHDDTAWENFGDTGIGTLSHAWSGGPTYYLTSQVLGVGLGWPGPSHPDTVLIAPLAETVNWAAGKVPHPRGIIDVHWELKGDLLELNYHAPAGVGVTVAPRGRLANKRLWVNGKH